MKKLIALLLLTAFALCAVACSEPEEEFSFAVSSRSEESLEAISSEAESSEAESSEAENEKAESSEAESSQTQSEVSEEDDEPMKIFGAVVGKRYINTFADIGFSAGEGWGFADFELLKQLNQITGEMLEEKYKEHLLEINVFYEMYAANNQGSYVTVVFEKMTEQQKEYFTDTSKFYNPANLANYENSFKEAGVVNFEYEVTTLKIDNRVFDGIHMTYIQNGNDMDTYEFVIIEGDYIVTCGVYTTGDADAKEILGWFDVY